MHSSFKTITHNIHGILEIFVPNPISIIKFTEDDLYNLTKIDLILPDINGMALVHLITKSTNFQLNVSIVSNANLALIVDAYGLIINNGTHIEAEQLFITNYSVDEEYFNEKHDILLMWNSVDRYMTNYGNIFARSQKNSAIAFNKFIDKGAISDYIDCKTYINLKKNQLMSLEFHESYEVNKGESFLSGLFSFIFGDDYG